MKPKTTKENDKARNELLEEIKHYKEMLAKLHPGCRLYKTTSGRLQTLYKELRDYDFFKGYSSKR